METRTTAGQVSWPMGKQPTGIFMFDGSNFCVQLAPTDHGAGDSGVVAMFGTDEVDEFAWVFVLTPEGAVDPSLVGSRIVRRQRSSHDEPSRSERAVWIWSRAYRTASAGSISDPAATR